jgi:hypothetical protein
MRVYFSDSVKDFPKKAGDLHLAWYQNGRICISRVLKDHHMQPQNFNIIQVNQITRAVWDRLSNPFKKDLAEYARRYKIQYPNLRKRGVSAYSVFLMVIHGLIRRFSIKTADAEKCSVVFDQLLLKMSVFKLIEFKILKPVRMSYQLNQENWINIFIFKKTSINDLAGNNTLDNYICIDCKMALSSFSGFI